MTLMKKAQKESRKSGKTVSREVMKGLRAVENMHSISIGTGSAYKIFLSQKSR